MKYRLPSSFLMFMCMLIVGATGFGGPSKANAEAPRPVNAGAPSQDTTQENPASPNLSGTWQMSWTARDGNQRQATLQLQQNGAKLSGKFEGARGSTSVTGNLEGDQVTLNVKLRRRKATFTGTVDGGKMSGTTEQGVSWTATRQ
jgi:hypothetical protein